MLMTMWNVWAHEYLAILVGCQLFTAYWLSAIIWSRFVNESHEYLINSFIDHRRKTQNVINQCWNLRSDPLTAWTGDLVICYRSEKYVIIVREWMNAKL